jgi:hypothetical protein
MPCSSKFVHGKWLYMLEENRRDFIGGFSDLHSSFILSLLLPFLEHGSMLQIVLVRGNIRIKELASNLI